MEGGRGTNHVMSFFACELLLILSLCHSILLCVCYLSVICLIVIPVFLIVAAIAWVETVICIGLCGCHVFCSELLYLMHE